MRSIIFTLLLISSSLSWSSDISIGGVSLVIPKPEGFSPVTPKMAVLYEAQKQFVAPTNEEFVTFIPDDVVEMVLKDEIPELPRRFGRMLRGGSVYRITKEKSTLHLRRGGEGGI